MLLLLLLLLLCDKLLLLLLCDKLLLLYLLIRYCRLQGSSSCIPLPISAPSNTASQGSKPAGKLQMACLLLLLLLLLLAVHAAAAAMLHKAGQQTPQHLYVFVLWLRLLVMCYCCVFNCICNAYFCQLKSTSIIAIPWPS
jgi:hypothetical protein